MRLSKLVDDINLDSQDIEYDPANMLIDSDNSNKSDLAESEDATALEVQFPADLTKITAVTDVARQTKVRDNSDGLDKFCIPCIESKLTKVIRQNWSITAISKN